MVDGLSHEDGARSRCPGDGGVEAQAIRGTRPSFRPRRPVHTAISFGKRLAEVGIVPSMGRTGTALDNAMAESFIATLKSELLVHRRRFPDREVARSAVFEYLEGFYNRRRLHSALSYRSPADYEEATMEGVAVA